MITKEMVEAAVAEVRKAKAEGVWDRWTDHDAVLAMLEAAMGAFLAEREKYASIADKYAQNNKGGRNPQSFAAYTVATEIARDIRNPPKPSF